MRILVALPYAPSRIRVRTYHLLRELARRHEITVLVVGQQPDVAADALKDISDDVQVVTPTLSSTVGSCALAGMRRESLQAAVNRSRSAADGLRRLIDDRRCDIVHVEHLRAAFLEAAIPQGIPRVFDAVDCISLLWERTRRSSHCLVRRGVATLELGPTRREEARLVQRFDQVAVTSPDDAEALSALAPSAPITVIPNGVDLEYFRPSGDPPEPRTIVFSGKMSYHANVTAALYFVRDVLSAHPGGCSRCALQDRRRLVSA